MNGYANYYFVQAQEERDHALLFMKYMQSIGLKVTLEAIEKPDKVFNSVLAPLEVAAEHERYVSDLINAIYHESYEAKDYRTLKFLDWFVNEQREEEDSADSMVSRCFKNRTPINAAPMRTIMRYERYSSFSLFISSPRYKYFSKYIQNKI